MKRMFIAAMALVSVVACSKSEEDVILTSSQKSVSVTIANAVSSRAVDATEADNVAAVGSDGKILGAGQNVVSAEYTELVFLFANKNGEIVEIRDAKSATPETETTTTGQVHTLRFHKVTEAAMQLAVVRYGDMAALKVGENLSAVRDEAANETANKEVELNKITLYGVDDLEANGTCQVEDHTYNLYKAVVTVAPLFARFEISGIECEDLGEATYGMATNTIDPTVATKGYDEITLQGITFGANNMYKYNFAEKPVLKGQYTGNVDAPQNTEYADTRVYVFDATVNQAIAAEGKYAGNHKDDANNAATMLAWNIAQQPAFSAENPLTLSIHTEAYDFINATKDTSVTVTGIAKDGTGVETFEAGNIYRLYLKFNEENIDSYPDGLCVDVEVTVANWVVNIVEPSFKTE